MKRISLLAFLGLFCALILSSAPAQAQATRTWVSGVGDDANSCSRTAPCKTFAGAISKTAAGGEISVLDPGGYGAVTITKSISIVQDSSGEAGILAAGTNGVTVNAGASDVVILRGLVIDGASAVSPGLNGIRFLAGASLHVQNCLIKNFTATSVPNGNGILFAASVASELYVSDTTFINNGTAAGAPTGGAIFIQPTGSAAAKVSINRIEMQNNRTGMVLDSTASTGAIVASVNQTTAVGNSGFGLAVTTAAAGGIAATMIINNSVVSNNNNGLVATGNAATIRVGGSLITGNTNATLVQSSGTITSYKNNLVDGNSSNTTPITGSALN